MKGYKAFYVSGFPTIVIGGERFDTPGDDGLFCFGKIHSPLFYGEIFFKAYEVGKTYYEEGTPFFCNHGMHFCKRLVGVFNYYPRAFAICEVEVPSNEEGVIVKCGNGPFDKCVTNKLTVVRKLSHEEIMDIAEKELREVRETIEVTDEKIAEFEEIPDISYSDCSDTEEFYLVELLRHKRLYLNWVDEVVKGIYAEIGKEEEDEGL